MPKPGALAKCRHDGLAPVLPSAGECRCWWIGCSRSLKAAVTSAGGASLELSADESPILTPYVGDLLVAYVVDEGSRVRLITEGERRVSDVSMEAMHDAAIANLSRQVGDRGIKLARHGGITALLFDGNFEATLLLCAELWPHLHEQLGAELLAVAPARDVLAVSPPENVNELREVISRVWPDGDHLLTREVYRRAENTWELYRPS